MKFQAKKETLALQVLLETQGCLVILDQKVIPVFLVCWVLQVNQDFLVHLVVLAALALKEILVKWLPYLD